MILTSSSATTSLTLISLISWIGHPNWRWPTLGTLEGLAPSQESRRELCSQKSWETDKPKISTLKEEYSSIYSSICTENTNFLHTLSITSAIISSETKRKTCIIPKSSNYSKNPEIPEKDWPSTVSKMPNYPCVSSKNFAVSSITQKWPEWQVYHSTSS